MSAAIDQLSLLRDTPTADGAKVSLLYILRMVVPLVIWAVSYVIGVLQSDHFLLHRHIYPGGVDLFREKIQFYTPT